MPDYAAPLLAARIALDAFEHTAAMVASRHPKYLPAARGQAETVLQAGRELLAWCEKESWSPVVGGSTND